MKKHFFLPLIFTAAVAGFPFLLSPSAFAHCDTVEGPVVKTAKIALDKGDVTPVLKWVKKENENEIRELFKKTVAVRDKGKDARELADMYFFETLVRVHRAGEGVPYTGIKPAGAVEPAVAEADKALESGSVEDLVKLVTESASKGIRERFIRARDAGKRAANSVEDGREYVERYVQFTHYVERLHLDAIAGAEGHHGELESSAEGQHKH